jgi:HD-GYP domain-containing protein (c-di-GMP phosphodiesterase class II)
MARSRATFQEGVVAICEVAELLADQLGLDADVQRDLALTIERWDGKGFLKRAKEDEIPASVRLAHIAECAAVYDELGGPDAARAVVRERAGTAFDPGIAEVFARHAETLLAPAPHLWAEVVADPAYEDGVLSDAEIDTSLRAVAQFVDLKSPFTVGHSTAVARLAQAAAEHAGLAAADAAGLARGGLLHDLGMVGVPSPVFEKRGPLTTDERERVRLHTYHGERIVAQSPALSALGAAAFRHHERGDGSGYHRGLDARSLSQPARLLAAADAFQSMTEERPYRAALTPEAAAAELRAEARLGRLDGEAAECVLAAATGRRKRRGEHPGGLTARELEVLRLVARGLATKQIAAELVITPKTADSHIQHVYAKLGVSTRAAATIFAMRHDLVDAGQDQVNS